MTPAPRMAEKGFQESLKRFETRLTAQERQQFKVTTLTDLQDTIMQIQSKQAAKSKAMNLARLRRFLEGFNQFGQVIEVFLNSHQFVALVWGPMKFLLQVASNFTDAFDTLLGAYEQIGECIPLVEQYRALFLGNAHMEEALAKIYDDILEFHRRALRFFTLPTWQQLFKSMWKDFDSRFKHILEDLRQHKALIESQASVLQYQQYQNDRQRLLGEIDKREIMDKKKRYTEILHWASVADSLSDHDDICAVRKDFPASGTWLLRNQTYSAWREDSVPRSSTLWLHGIPGAGKTVLASLVIEDCKRDSNAEVLYFYCKHGDPQRTTCAAVLRTLLCQLLKYDHDLLPWIYDQHLISGQLSLVSVDLCKDLLKTVILDAKKVYLVIDGLDECDSKQRKLLTNAFSDMISICDAQNPGQLRIMLVSQDEAEIRKNLSLFVEIPLRKSDNEKDINLYVSSWCDKIRDKFELLDGQKDFIQELTCHRADGMFLFVKLVMDNLYHQIDLEGLREQTQPHVFPSGLAQAYDRILSRLRARPSPEWSMAKTVLGWMVCARRPLKWHEIQSISSIDIKSDDVNFVEKMLRIHIRDVCGSLVIQLSGDRLELVHSSAKYYLTQSEFIQPSNIEIHLTALCLKYLTFDCFDTDLSDGDRRGYLMDGYFAFQDYAVTHWSDHLASIIETVPGTSLSAPQDTAEELYLAVTDFVAKFQLFEQQDQHEIVQVSECDRFREFDFFDDLKHAHQHIQQQKAKGPKAFDDIDPKPLDTAVLANRALLEGLATSTTLDLGTKQKLVSFYGTNWYKCSRATCFYFHEGFEDDEARGSHILRHEKPFRCSLQDCETGFRIGFTSKKDLDKHTIMYHPELGQTGTRFSRLRNPRSSSNSGSSSTPSPSNTKHPASHACDLCPKRFTRANILRSHQLKHKNEKPFVCTTCNQTFRYDNDRKRHERSHTGEKRFICEVKCAIPPRDTGCGKEFPRADALANHLRKGAGKACIAPLLEEQRSRQQWEFQIEEIRAKGSTLPIPSALLEQYPDFDASEWRQLLESGTLDTLDATDSTQTSSQQDSQVQSGEE